MIPMTLNPPSKLEPLPTSKLVKRGLSNMTPLLVNALPKKPLPVKSDAANRRHGMGTLDTQVPHDGEKAG
jgi:hypothetical protein